jgi:HAE1 family hydrophobic/amphiphilic exporter-1
MSVLSSTADEIIAIVSTIPAVHNAECSLEEGVPQATVRVDRPKATYFGLQQASVSGAVQMAINGMTVSRYKVDGSEIDIVMRYDPSEMRYLENLQNMVFTTPMGTPVALHEFADIVLDTGPGAITKDNARRYVSVTAEIIGSDLNTVSRQVSNLLSDFELAEGYSWELGSTYTTMMESFFDLAIALVLGFVMVYMVVASQFESLIYPFIIIFSIPISMTAGLLGLFITRQSINILAIIGLILLMGVVVNNGIVLIDFIHIKRGEGKTTREAILEAGPIRLRPILMTTITTVLGLMPLMLATGEGSELHVPMGAIISSGLTLATLITLLLIPTIYELIYDFRNRERRANG